MNDLALDEVWTSSADALLADHNSRTRRRLDSAPSARIRGLLGQDIPRTRKILRRLLVGRLECEAFDEGKRIGYRFTARGSYAPPLPVEVSTPEMVTPAGFEPAFPVRHALSSKRRAVRRC